MCVCLCVGGGGVGVVCTCVRGCIILCFEYDHMLGLLICTGTPILQQLLESDAS